MCVELTIVGEVLLDSSTQQKSIENEKAHLGSSLGRTRGHEYLAQNPMSPITFASDLFFLCMPVIWEVLNSQAKGGRHEAYSMDRSVWYIIQAEDRQFLPSSYIQAWP